MIRTLVAVVAAGVSVLGIAPVGAFAQGADCLPGVYSDTLAVARVAKARGRVHFFNGTASRKDCPKLSADCRTTTYLVGGDVVLTSLRRDGFVCATYANAQGRDTSGWMPADALEPLSADSVAVPGGWTGEWKRIEAQITIKPASGGAIAIEGSATWGANDAGRVKRGTVRSGAVSAVARPSGDSVFFTDGNARSFESAGKDTCAVRMRRIAQYLLVEDNDACGGINVSFSGIYVRR